MLLRREAVFLEEFFEATFERVDVADGGFNVGMSEHFLGCLERGAVEANLCRKGVAERMGVKIQKAGADKGTAHMNVEILL